MIAAVSVVMLTLLVAVLEGPFGVPNASAAYLLAVVAVAALIGTGSAIVAAIGGFLAYDFFFTQPTYTLTVSDPGEWLNLVLLLVVGMVVGQLAGLQRQRAHAAIAREREALGLFRVSRALATSRDTPGALPEILDVLRAEVGLRRAWVALGEGGDRVRVAADTGTGAVPTLHASYHALQRRPGDQPAEWVRVHSPKRAGFAKTDDVKLDGEPHRVKIEANGHELGSLWATTPRGAATPDRSQTRLLSAAADQIGQALERDRLALEATSAEIARRSDALKSALLDSVSHDLRTPLASIRAAAGSLMDPGAGWSPKDEHDAAAAIDREAERLNRLVSNLLDLSRIEAGGLKPQTGTFVVADLVEHTLGRLRPLLEARHVEVDVPDSVPPVRVDDVYMDQVMTNLLENAARYTPATAVVRITAAQRGASHVTITVEDGGPGVPPEAMARLFDKFYRVPRVGEGARRGTGIGLTVVRGLAEAMGATIDARRSALGGLAFDLVLPADAAPETAEAVPDGRMPVDATRR